MSDPRICPRCGASLDRTVPREDVPQDQRTPWQSMVLGPLPQVQEAKEIKETE